MKVKIYETFDDFAAGHKTKKKVKKKKVKDDRKRNDNSKEPRKVT